MKKITILLTIGFLLSFVQAAYAQSASGSAQESTSSAQNIKKFKITFPIAELGDCADLVKCKVYCDDEANKDACLAYAQKRGFVRNKKKLNVITRSVLLEARALLGCSTDQGCKDFCKLEENKEKCSMFAQTYRLKGGLKIGALNGKLRKLMNSSGSGDFKGLKDASGSAEKFTPNSQRAFERANANARFCRENPGKCTRDSSASAELEERKLKQKVEGEIKELRVKEEKIMREEKKLKELKAREGKRKFEDVGEDGTSKPEVQGVSSSPSFFEKITRFFK